MDMVTLGLFLQQLYRLVIQLYSSIAQSRFLVDWNDYDMLKWKDHLGYLIMNSNNLVVIVGTAVCYI